MSALHLYQLTGQYQTLLELADSDDLPPEVIRDTIEGLDGEWADKAIAVAAFIKNLEHASTGIDAAAAVMLQRAKRLQARADSLRQYLLFNMQGIGKTRVESPQFVLAVRNNPPAVVIDEPAAIPKKFWHQAPPPPPTLQKREIAAAIKAGEEVPGAHTEVGQRLDISA